MARKRKRGPQIEHNWKPVTIECTDGLDAEDFEGIVALEELNDYEVVKEEQTPTETNIKKKKKKQKKFNEFEVEEIELEDLTENIEDENVDMSEWENLSVPDHVIQCLRDQKMLHPTPIQTSTIPVAIEDRLNIYGAAPTGSGKTLAFAIPIVTNIVEDQNNQNGDYIGPKSIILTPTRELAVQIKFHVENICKYNGLRVALIVGGLAIQKQQRVLIRKKPDIIVATPGRLWEIINDGLIPFLSRESLTKIKYLVIDEADRMIERSHFEELRFIIDFLNESSKPQDRQVFIFSATLTMNKKQKKENFIKQKKKGDQENLIKLLNLDTKRLKICDLTEGGMKSKPGSEQLTESIIHCMKNDKDLYLYYFLTQNSGRTMIFCNSIDCIRRLLNIFRFLQLNPLAIHSSMPQKRRLSNIERFTSSSNSLLFATDVAARGLDIPGVDHVVHYQVPRTAEVYVHRSGRTARLQNKGLTLILCDPKEEAFFLRDFSNIIKKETLSEYIVNSRILTRIKERIRLAQSCDNLEHKLRKDRSENDWIKKTAEACDIILDSDDSDQVNDIDEDSSIKERKDLRRKLKLHQKQLNTLLRQPINIRSKKIIPSHQYHHPDHETNTKVTHL